MILERSLACPLSHAVMAGVRVCSAAPDACRLNLFPLGFLAGLFYKPHCNKSKSSKQQLCVACSKPSQSRAVESTGSRTGGQGVSSLLGMFEQSAASTPSHLAKKSAAKASRKSAASLAAPVQGNVYENNSGRGGDSSKVEYINDRQVHAASADFGEEDYEKYAVLHDSAAAQWHISA